MTDPEKKPLKRRRWWLRGLIAAALFLVALPFAVPFAVGIFGPGVLASRLEGDYHVTASLEELAVRPSGSVRARGLRVDDLDERPVLRLDVLDAKVDVLGALRGRYDVDFTVEGFELHLRRDEDGRWNVESLPREEPRRAGSGRRSGGDEVEPLPEIAARVKVSDAKVVVHDGDQATELALVAFELTLDALDGPAEFSGEGFLSGAGSGGGAFDLDGAIVMAEGGRIAPRGELSLALGEVLLSGLRPLFARFVPLDELDGRLAAAIRLGLDSTTGPTGEVSVTALDLSFRGPEGEPFEVKSLSCEGIASSADSGPGSQRLTVSADDLFELGWEGTTIRGEEGARVQGRLTLASKLDEVAEFARAWTPALAERELTGAVNGSADLSIDLALGRTSAVLAFAITDLAGLAADGNPLVLTDGLDELHSSARVNFDRGAFEIPELTVSGPLDLRASVEPVAGEDGPPALATEFTLNADLGRVRPLLAAFTAEPPGVTGRVHFDGILRSDDDGGLALTLAGTPERFVFEGSSFETSRIGLDATAQTGGDALPFTLSVRAADVVFTPEPAGGEPAAPIATPRFECDGRGELVGSKVELTELALDSDVLSGTITGTIESGEDGLAFDGLVGDLTYVPDQLGAMLAGRLPGELSGSEPRPISFELTGKPGEMDAASLLGALDGTLELGLGNYEFMGFGLAGDLVAQFDAGKMVLEGILGANGGELVIDGAVNPGELAEGEPSVRLGVRAGAVRANPEVARLFSFVHPMFAQVEELDGGLDGLVEAELELSYGVPLAWEELAQGLAALSLSAFTGKGKLEVRDIAIEGSPLLQRLKGELQKDAAKELRVRPMSFRIDGGRLFYDNPWTWTIADTETTFTGSVGFDETLDLVWNVPVTTSLVERYDFLKYLQGDVLSVPLGGTASRPQLEWSGLIDELAKTALTRGLGDAIGLGGGDREDPAEILERADALWATGERAEAGKLYQQIREDHKLSLVYLLNKDRIKERRKFQE